MNFRQARELDAYITGHYGEDQFRDWEEFPETAHALYRVDQGDIVYNPADDGPEVDVIRTIEGVRTIWEERQERFEYAIHTQQAVSASHGQPKPQ